MIFRPTMLIAIVFLYYLTHSIALAADFSGVPRIVDGDTLAIGAIKVRLEGIDAPETDQVCLNASGERWTCGIEARDQLLAHVASREIKCSSSGIDAYQRTLGTCYLADEDLNGWLVQEGWALAYVKYSKAYVQAEEDGQRNGNVASKSHYSYSLDQKWPTFVAITIPPVPVVGNFALSQLNHWTNGDFCAAI
jgi:endonuclease YncB( thermonuclease family)